MWIKFRPIVTGLKLYKSDRKIEMKSEINILMIDDDEDDFIIAKDLFAEIHHHKYSIDWVQSYNDGLKHISKKTHDVYLVDYRLGADNGLELISEALKNGCDVPLILLTGQNDIEVDKQAMKFGASDYLVKGNISASQLERSIRYSIEQAKNIKEIKQLNVDSEKRVTERTAQLENNIQQLKESEEKYSSLFNSIDEGYCIIEMIFNEQKKPVDYRFLEINASFERQTGLRDAVGKRMREFAPDHEEYWFEIYGKIALTGESARFENRAEQLHRWYDVYAFRLGKPKNLQVALLFNDITERKKTEEQLQAVNKELESFSYSVSHDLRAPLRAISGYAKILEEDYFGKFDSDGTKALHSIMYNSKRMGELIDDLLAFSRLGRTEVTTSEINMTALVKSVREEEMNGNSNEIEFVIHELPSANGGQVLIKQVWVNLISNAIKYSKHKHKPKIEIGAYHKDNLVVYYIKDNGVGFDMQYYNKLFGVFQRLHSQEEFEGTGVGLAIVQKIIHRHNGTVWAESKLNEGACFYFSLPNINS